jgi:hypothetical protein
VIAGETRGASTSRGICQISNEVVFALVEVDRVSGQDLACEDLPCEDFGRVGHCGSLRRRDGDPAHANDGAAQTHAESVILSCRTD